MRYLVALFLLIPITANAATFERVQENLVGWNYTYQGSVLGRQVPIYFTLRECANPTVVSGQGYSPINQCFDNEGAARIASQAWADKEELRYRDVQDPTPAPIKAIKKLWKKVTGS